MFILELWTGLSLCFQPTSSHAKRIYYVHCLKHEASLRAARSSLILTSVLKWVSEWGRWPFFFPWSTVQANLSPLWQHFFLPTEAPKGLSCRCQFSVLCRGFEKPLSRGEWCGCRTPLSEDAGHDHSDYKLSPASVLLGGAGASHSLCFCLQMWYRGDGKNFPERHSLDWWKEKLPSSGTSVSAPHGVLQGGVGKERLPSFPCCLLPC